MYIFTHLFLPLALESDSAAAQVRGMSLLCQVHSKREQAGAGEG